MPTMRRVGHGNFHKNSAIEHQKLHDCKAEKGVKETILLGIKDKISELAATEREEPQQHYCCSHDKSESSYNVFREIKKHVNNFLKDLFKSGEMDEEEYHHTKKHVNEFLDENKDEIKELFYSIMERDLTTQIDAIDAQIAKKTSDVSSAESEEASFSSGGGESDLSSEDISSSARSSQDIKKIELTLTNTLQFNNLGNSLLNTLNKVDPFTNPNQLSGANRQIAKADIGSIHAKARETILGLDPSLKDELDQIDAQSSSNPDPEQAYLNYAVAMVPIDISGKAIDIVNNERNGNQEAADLDRQTLTPDMLDFYKYLSNLKANL